MYSEEVPLVYWDGMEPYVKDAYVLAYEQLAASVSKGQSLSESVLVKELTQGLTNSEQRFFADRVAVIQEIVDGKSYSVDDVLRLYGEYIRDCKHKEFDRFAADLAESETLPESYPPESPAPQSQNVEPFAATLPESYPPESPATQSQDVSPDIKPEAPSQRNFRIYEGH